MTDEKMLLERLIEEAVIRGRVEQQRDDAVTTMEKAGNAFTEFKVKYERLVQEHDRVNNVSRMLDHNEVGTRLVLDRLFHSVTNYMAARGGDRRSWRRDVTLSLITAAHRLGKPSA